MSTASAHVSRTPETVADVMTPEVTTLALDRTILDAVQLFGESGFRHVLVVDGAGRLEGVVSDRDALRALARGHDAGATKVASIMAREPVVTGSDTPLADAIDLVVFHRIHCLPVVDAAGTLRGIVTTTDLLGAFRTLLGHTRRS